MKNAGFQQLTSIFNCPAKLRNEWLEIHKPLNLNFCEKLNS